MVAFLEQMELKQVESTGLKGAHIEEPSFR